MTSEHRPVPCVLVAGIDVAAMESVTLAAMWDHPSTVVVRHDIDASTSSMSRTVSCADGVLETAVIDLDHACVACALREDVLPTLSRLARSGRWSRVVAHLPATADPVLVSRAARTAVSAGRRLARDLRVAHVVTAVDGPTLLADVVGGDDLAERGLATSDDDDRGVGMTVAGQLEYADTIAVAGRLEPAAEELLRALRRPGVAVVPPVGIDLDAMIETGRDVRAADGWVDPLARTAGPADPGGDDLWWLDLTSWRPLHPERLVDHIEILGGGPRRSRGCCWVPGRRNHPIVWDGAGGQLSVGSLEGWRGREPFTRIAMCGLDEGAEEVREAFERTLMTDAELARGLAAWSGPDGLEAWLGDVGDAA